MKEIKKVIRKPGEAIDPETEFFLHPDLLPYLAERIAQAPESRRAVLEKFMEEYPASTEMPAKTGHFERFEYTTDVYEDGKVYPKYANVYLPYCYDPEDHETKYDVIYFQHGNTRDPEEFKEPWDKVLLDRLFLMEEIRPCIMVFTTYYFDVIKDADIRRRSGDVPAGDGMYPGIAPNYYKEITEDLIPAVETHYNTWLTDTTDEAVRNTRDHRLFSGYSRGCVCTWYMLHNAFPYFRYYVPMSCVTSAGKPIREPLTVEAAADYLTAPLQQYPDLPCFIFAFNGGQNDIPGMPAQMNELIKRPEISFGKDPSVNNFYYCESSFFHSDFFAPAYYYNALPIIQK